jgi:hypothetical protein
VVNYPKKSGFAMIIPKYMQNNANIRAAYSMLTMLFVSFICFIPKVVSKAIDTKIRYAQNIILINVYSPNAFLAIVDIFWFYFIIVFDRTPATAPMINGTKMTAVVKLKF